jgi:hypothetical protein
VVLIASVCVGAAADAARYDYRLPATTKTCTVRKDMNQATATRYVFAGVMGGKTALGGSEVVVVEANSLSAEAPGRRKYKLPATSRTSTMQEQTEQAGNEGFEDRGQTVLSPPWAAARWS